MDRTRVLEIIAAYGADVTRWPDAEGAAAQALVARDPELRAQIAAAAALDAELAVWVTAPVAIGDIDATIAADAALAKAPPPNRWWPTAVLSGAVAAALVAAVAVLPTRTSNTAPDATQVARVSTAPVQTAQVEQDVQLWASVFTLTPEEESLI